MEIKVENKTLHKTYLICYGPERQAEPLTVEMAPGTKGILQSEEINRIVINDATPPGPNHPVFGDMTPEKAARLLTEAIIRETKGEKLRGFGGPGPHY